MTLEIIIAILVTAAVIDVVSDGIIGYIAIAITSGWIASKFTVDWQWMALTWIGCTGAGAVAYFYCIAGVRKGVSKLEGKAHWKDTGSGAVGEKAKARIIEGTLMLEWNGDLWPVSTDRTTLQDGDQVTILALEDGKLSV